MVQDWIQTILSTEVERQGNNNIQLILRLFYFFFGRNPNLEFASQSQNEEDETNWAKFSIPELAYKDIAPSMKDSRALRSAQCQFWNEYLPKLNDFIGKTTPNGCWRFKIPC